MTSCDANILLFAYNNSTEEHPAALTFINQQLDNPDFALSEWVLMELYVLLRNPSIFDNPFSAGEASEIIGGLRAHPKWSILKGATDVSEKVWRAVASEQFPRRAIFDARIAYSLAAEGVKQFATHNIKDFQRFGVLELFDPLA